MREMREHVMASTKGGEPDIIDAVSGVFVAGSVVFRLGLKLGQCLNRIVESTLGPRLESRFHFRKLWMTRAKCVAILVFFRLLRRKFRFGKIHCATFIFAARVASRAAFFCW